MTDYSLWQPVLVSLQVGLASTALSLVLGTLLGVWLARRGRRWAQALVLLPLVLPPTVLGYYLLVLIGRRGPVGVAWEAVFGSPLVFTLQAAVLAACVSTIPIVARQMAAAFLEISPDILEAARLDGAGFSGLLRHIEFPLVRGPLLAASAIAFARSVGDFGTTLMVAGSLPGRAPTAAIAIYDLMNAGRMDQALVLVVMISLVSMAVLALTSAPRRELPGV